MTYELGKHYVGRPVDGSPDRCLGTYQGVKDGQHQFMGSGHCDCPAALAFRALGADVLENGWAP
ncbi:hypothetical protein SEA_WILLIAMBOONE_80 [Gordonia phage WilliamBoone]|nr:hypothetical protein SEA_WILLIAMBOONE_80 [Gordonia phage WilliamBoone]